MAGYWVSRNTAIRALCIPFIQIARKWRTKKYVQSEDSRYIRSLKNKYEGETCFIIGNGPSLRAEDLTKLKGKFTMAFNRIFNIYPDTDWRPTVYMVMDSTILDELYQEDLSKIGAEMQFVANQDMAKKWKDSCNIHYINKYGKNSIKKERMVIEHISEDVSKYFTINLTVVINALELAFYMGFKTIYLLGIDHDFPIEVSMQGKRTVNTDVNNAHFSQNTDQRRYIIPKEAMTRNYEICRNYAEEHGIKIYNATRGGKLEVFERVDFDTLFAADKKFQGTNITN